MCIQCQHKVCAQHVVYEYETERPMHSVCPPAGGFNTKWEVSSFEQQYNRAMREHRQRSAARQTRGREQEVRSRIESFLAAMRDTGDKGSRRVSRRRMVPRRMRSGLVAKDEPFPDRGWHVGDHAGDSSAPAFRIVLTTTGAVLRAEAAEAPGTLVLTTDGEGNVQDATPWLPPVPELEQRLEQIQREA